MLPEFPLIIADESVDFRIIHGLRAKGYNVHSIITDSPGITDSRVIEIAIEKNGFILTEDKDFGDELVYRRSDKVGSLLLRISDMAVDARNNLVIDTIINHGKELKGCFSVLTARKLRVRKYL